MPVDVLYILSSFDLARPHFWLSVQRSTRFIVRIRISAAAVVFGPTEVSDCGSAQTQFRTTMSPTFQERVKERIAWLRRMPRHWKLLFASQGLFMAFAVSYRRRVIQEIFDDEEREREAERRAKLLLEMRDAKRE